jgi:hypothetical protein
MTPLLRVKGRMKRRYFRPTGTIIQVGRLIAAPSDLGFADSGCRHLLHDHSHVAARNVDRPDHANGDFRQRTL